MRVVIESVNTQKASPSASIVILAWNAWKHTYSCLESLRPTLRPGDQVVVVDNGSTDVTAVELAKYPWIEVLSNKVNRGFAVGCNQGAAVARGDVLVFLNNDTVVFEGWLDELLSPFDDPQIGAVGPRSNRVSGHQLIQDVPYHAEDMASARDFAITWQKAHAGEISECARLVGFCLAVRADVFQAVDGFDEGYVIGGYEDDDLCMKLRGEGLHLAVAHGSFVHHVAHVSFDSNRVDWRQQEIANQRRFREKWGTDHVSPLCLLSVCLIVKDEERMLQACLESVADIADEIVVYDTGSSDRTVEIAQAAGARVIEGYWDDSFARARNAVLEQAKGEWVLSIDADENLLADPKSLRAMLADRRSDLEAYLVAIENLHGEGNARFVHTATRLFRRTSCTWRHRLHEQIAAVDDPNRALRTGYLSGTRIIHHGYMAEVFDSKNKAERNLALAQSAVDDNDLSKPYALMNYGRALEAAGRSNEAVETLLEAASISDSPITQRLAVVNLIYILGRLKRIDEALVQVEELRRLSFSQIAADIAEGRLRISMGDAVGGLAMLARVPLRGRDDDGMEYAAHMLASIRGEALASLGRFAEAADAVLEAVRSEGVLEADLGELTFWLLKAGKSPSEIAEALDVRDLMPVLGRVLRQAPVVADVVLDGIWNKFPDRLEPLAAAGRLGPRLPVARALVWSSRLRQMGLDHACPLVAMVNDENLDPRIRILAGAAAFGSFGDRSIINAVHEARSRLDAEALKESTDEIGRIAPGLLEASPVDHVPVNDGASLSVAVKPTHRGRQSPMVTVRPKVAAAPRRGGINIVGPFESTSVYGQMSRAIASTFSSHGALVSTTSYHSDGQRGPLRWTHRDEGDHPFDTTLMVLSPADLANFIMDNGAASFEGRYMVGVWSWDFERPSQIMQTAALGVHEIWAPTAFAAGAIAGVTERPVARMILPVTTFWPGSKEVPAGPGFVFQASVDYASGFERQNPLGIVEAFCTAFLPGAGPKLVIETTNSGRYPADHARLVDAAAGRPDVVLADNTSGSSGRILSGSVTGRCCFVSLHRSEGTGLAIAGAMARGIPTIVTGHSFSAELQGKRDSFQVSFVLEPIPACEYQLLPGGQWAEPDLDEAAKLMRLVVEQPKLAIAKARRAKERELHQSAPARSIKVMKDRLADIDHRRHGDLRGVKKTMSAVGPRS